MLAIIRNDTWNVLKMLHISPNSKNGIIQISPVVVLEKIKGPDHMVEGDNHLRKRPQAPPTASLQVPFALTISKDILACQCERSLTQIYFYLLWYSYREITPALITGMHLSHESLSGAANRNNVQTRPPCSRNSLTRLVFLIEISLFNERSATYLVNRNKVVPWL